MAESTGSETGEPVRGGQYSGPVASEPAPVHDHHDDPAFVTRTRFLTGVALVTGGVMTADDLKNYRAIERPVVRGTYRGYDVVSMPPPSTQRRRWTFSI